MTKTTSTSTIREFLALPGEALPGARFADEDDSWAHDAWVVLRRHVKTGESIAELCGTQIVLRADRPEWRDGVTVG